MGESTDDILHEAIGRNLGAVLSLPSAGMLRHHKSRFLAEANGDILIESIPAENNLIDEVIASGKSVGISFKNSETKAVFGVPIIERIPHHRINSAISVPALRLPWPSEVKTIQRRSTYRVRVVGDLQIAIRVWRMTPIAALQDKPADTAEVRSRIIDLSVGGIGVFFSAGANNELKIDPADRLRIEICFAEHKMLLEGRMRHPEKVPKDCTTLRAGIQFCALQADMFGRQHQATLTKVLGVLQRAEVRRARRNMLEPV